MQQTRQQLSIVMIKFACRPKYVPSYVYVMLRAAAIGIFICDSDRPNVRSKSATIKQKTSGTSVSGQLAVDSAKMNKCALGRQFALRFSLSRETVLCPRRSEPDIFSKYLKLILALLTGNTEVSDFKESTGKLQEIADNVGDFDRNDRDD